MQHETALGLNRATEVDGIVLAGCNLELEVDPIEQLAKSQISRAIDDEAKRAAVIVVAHIDDRALKVGIRHRGHGDQELMLQVHGAMDLRFARHEAGL